MNEHAKLLFSQHAGSPLPDDLPSTIREFVAGIVERRDTVLEQIAASHPEYTDGIYVDFVDDASLNALAYSDGKNEFIGINGGIALILPLAYNWLLAHPDVFPDIGDPKSETRPPPFDESLLRMRGKLSEVSENMLSGLAVIPSDPIRAHYAMTSCAVAMDFLLWHELAHLNRCHIRYLSSRSDTSRSTNSWFEFAPALPSEECELRRILEIDADGVAGRVVGGAPIINGLEKAKWVAYGDNCANMPWDWSEAFLAWTRSIGVLFHFLSMIENAFDIDEPSRTHPHPDIRLQALMNTIWPQWKKVIPDQEVYRTLIRRSARSMHELFQLRILPSPASRLTESYNREHFADAVRSLFDSYDSHAKGLNALTTERLKQRGATLKS